MSTHTTSEKVSYEPPEIRPLGSVHALTQHKDWGSSDGWAFGGWRISNTS